MKKLTSIIIALSMICSTNVYPQSYLAVPGSEIDLAEALREHAPWETKTVDMTMTQLNKAYEAFNKGDANKIRIYDLTAPQAPHGGGYLIAAGLEVALNDIRKRRFTKKYIDALKAKKIYSEEFLEYLSKFSFAGDIDAVREGTVVSPGIPLMRIKATAVEIALLEDLIKNKIGTSTNVATKTSRITRAANGEFVTSESAKKKRGVAEFGLRRGHGKGAHINSRSAIIGGAVKTSNVRAGEEYGLDITGTVAHLFVMIDGPDFETDSFRSYAEAFPDKCILLIDTYETLEGAKRAVIVAKELQIKGHAMIGVRLDSGDLVDLSQKVRKIFDDAGLPDVKIVASDDLDEEKITELLEKGAQIDLFGVGTNLITGGKQAFLKLELQESDGERIFRVSKKDTGKVLKYIETHRMSQTVFLKPNEQVEELLKPFWRKGNRVRENETVSQFQKRAIEDLDNLDAEFKTLSNAKQIPTEKQDTKLIINPETDALLVVDAQPTFMPGGGLPVTDGDKIVPFIKKLMELFPKENRFATRDVHPKGHISLASSYNGLKPMETELTYEIVKDWRESDNMIAEHAKFTLEELKEYLKKVGKQVLWPDHGLYGEDETKIHPDIEPDTMLHEINVFIKGTDPKCDSYSAFFDNLGRPTKLTEVFRKLYYKRIFCVGLAEDYCVGWSAEGAHEEGFEVIVVQDATKPVGFPEGSVDKMHASFEDKRIELVEKTDDIVIANTSDTNLTNMPFVYEGTYEHPVFSDFEDRTALTEDTYHLTMGQALFKKGRHEKQATFDYFYRTPPYKECPYIIVSGLRFFLEELKNFRFTENHIAYLRKEGFDEGFLQYLKDFKFKGTIQGLPEGSVAYPHEPILTVSGTVFETMIIETFILNTLNYNSLIATWASVQRQKYGEAVLIEDLLEYTHGVSHAEAAYSAYIGGVNYTTNLDAHVLFGIPLIDPKTFPREKHTVNIKYLDPDFITGGPKSSLGGVYKLSEYDGQPRLKLSNTFIKISLPGKKTVYDIVTGKNKVTKRITALQDEQIRFNNTSQSLVQRHTKLVDNGKVVYRDHLEAQHARSHRMIEVKRYKGITQTQRSPELVRLQAQMIAQARDQYDAGKMRIAMAQVNVKIGDLNGNYKKIVNYIREAQDNDVDVVVFPELTITGYPPEDLVYKKHFIADNRKVLDAIIEKTKNITVIVGFIDRDKEGNLYNAAAIISNKELKGVYHKKDLPNYGVFDEKRYFVSGNDATVIELHGVPTAVNVCEDIWVDKNGIYMQQYEKGARLFFNISASPFHEGKLKERHALLSQKVKQTNAFFVYVNHVGGQDEVVYDGGSFIMSPNGTVVAQAELFKEELVMIDLDVINGAVLKKNELTDKKPLRKRKKPKKLTDIETIYKAIVLGTRDYIRKNGFKKVVIGLSGGIDSALVAAIAVDALGADNVLCISMPSQFNSEETQSDAKKQAGILGVHFKEVPITNTFGAFNEMLQGDPDFQGKKFSVTDENLQARIRGNILMAYSNEFGYMVLSTSNKSESAVGYTTLYGDMSGGFAPIKDVPKTVVFELSRFLNEQAGREIILTSIIERPPSAELREGQLDEETLPPYPVLDAILEAYLIHNNSVGQMSERWDRDTVVNVVEMIDRNEFKRRQAPPGVKITPRNFGRDRRMPITNGYREASRVIDANLSSAQ